MPSSGSSFTTKRAFCLFASTECSLTTLNMKAAGSWKNRDIDSNDSIRLRSINVFPRLRRIDFKTASLIRMPATWKAGASLQLSPNTPKRWALNYANTPSSLRWLKALVASKAASFKIEKPRPARGADRLHPRLHVLRHERRRFLDRAGSGPAESDHCHGRLRARI